MQQYGIFNTAINAVCCHETRLHEISPQNTGGRSSDPLLSPFHIKMLMIHKEVLFFLFSSLMDQQVWFCSPIVPTNCANSNKRGAAHGSTGCVKDLWSLTCELHLQFRRFSELLVSKGYISNINEKNIIPSLHLVVTSYRQQFRLHPSKID